MLGDTQLCPTCGIRRKRSIGQNARYWSILRAMAKHSGQYSAEVWHEYFKKLFLPRIERELPDWTTILIPMSTANLPMEPDPKDPDAPNWRDYTTQVEVWCAERGVYLQEGE